MHFLQAKTILVFSQVAQATIATMPTAYESEALSRTDTDAMQGPTLIEFGSNHCGWCQGAQPAIDEALQGQAGLRHLRIEDGKGRPLGRSYGVKLWPTLVFLRDGREVARLVRPQGSPEIRQALDQLA